MHAALCAEPTGLDTTTAALLNFKYGLSENSTLGTPLAGWTQSVSPCDWRGVTCDVEDGQDQVTQMWVSLLLLFAAVLPLLPPPCCLVGREGVAYCKTVAALWQLYIRAVHFFSHCAAVGQMRHAPLHFGNLLPSLCLFVRRFNTALMLLPMQRPDSVGAAGHYCLGPAL